MEVILLVVHLLIAIALVGIVLLQPSEGGALGQGQGPGGLSGMMQGRSAASSLTRATVWLGVAFFATSITLTLLAKANRATNPLAPAISTGAPQPGGGSTSIPIPDGGLLGPAPATSVPPAPASSPPAPAAGDAAPAAAAPTPETSTPETSTPETSTPETSTPETSTPGPSAPVSPAPTPAAPAPAEPAPATP